MCSELSKGKQKAYWKLLKKLDKKSDNNECVPNQKLVDHFKDMLHNDDAPNISKTEEIPTGPLDQEITMDELKTASKVLKPGKQPGIDIIANEMISPLIEKYPNLILKLFNSILNNLWINEKWLISIISAIHKKGAKDDPDNYRGISLMSCLGKLFLSVINNRITGFVTENNILSCGALGFVKGNRTSDPHIILNTLIQKYCHKGGKKLYGCFVDFSKAFDTVPRDILISKLESVGIKGKILEIIKIIYTEDKACVKIGNKCSSPFRTNMGVRQGCVLSPTLFNIFLSDIQNYLSIQGENPSLSNQDISSLLWADDILIFSTSEKGLQEKLNNLKSYCLMNKLKVNTDKTKVMIFNKSGRKLNNKFKYGKITLENVRSYKYLGFMVTPSGEIKTGLNDLRIRGLKALLKIKKSLGIHFHSNIYNTIHLFNYMVRPILLYCSDFWGCLKHPKDSPIAKVHLSFCKQLLGVRKQTNTSAVLLELNTVPILIHAKKASIKNWERIRNSSCPKLLKHAFSESLFNNLNWASSISNTFNRNGMSKVFSSVQFRRGNQPLPSTKLYQRLLDQFHQNALSDIKSCSKLKLYSTLKLEIGPEKYLCSPNIKCRQALTRFRLCSHSLNVEKGRHRQIPREDRICPLCKNGVEDETHFLITCPSYNDLRSKYILFAKVNKLFFLDDSDKLLILLNEDNQYTISKYIHEANSLRDVMMMYNQPLMTL